MSNYENVYWKTNTTPYSWLPKGKTVTWSGTDTLENFKKNKDQQYTINDVDYKYNPQGFRTKNLEEYKGKKVNIALGCSFTEGVGLPENEIWPTYVEQQTEFPILNLGLGGASSDSIARILTNIIGMFDIQTVYILWPPHSRFEYFESLEGVLVMNPGQATSEYVWNLDDINSLQRYYKNKFLVETLGQLHGFNVIDQAWHDIDLIFRRFPQTFARDGQHFGPLGQKIIADRFLSHSKTTIYVNGEGTSLGIQAGGLSNSYGNIIAQNLNAVLVCDAMSDQTNEQIAKRTLDYAINNKDSFIVVGWNTWEVENFDYDGTSYVFSGGCNENDYPKELRKKYTEWKKDLYSEDRIAISEKKNHDVIWELHCRLTDLGVKHLFFNILAHFSTITDKKKWGNNFVYPYVMGNTMHKFCKNSSSDDFHFNSLDHIKWAEFLLPKLNEL